MSSIAEQHRPAVTDDVPVTAVAEHMGDRFFDRFYFNLHAPSDPVPLVMLGLGIYPTRGSSTATSCAATPTVR